MKGTKLIDFVVYVTVFMVAFNIHCVYSAYSYTMETEIRNETLYDESYDPVSRPSTQTHIKVGLNVLAIDELDLKGQKLTMAGWLTFEWHDDRLLWNKSAKNDMKYIFAKPKTIWKPELIIDNELKDLDIIQSDELLLRVRYDGLVDWEPAMLFVTHCEVDITYYPYDQQRCAVELVSWTYTYDEVNLEHLFETVNLEDFEVHGEWKLHHTALEDRNLTEHLPDGTVIIYPQINFWMYLNRRTQFYNLNVMMPIILTSLMVVMVFLVPVHSGEKVSYVLTVFLSLAVLLTIVTETLPPTSINVSVLGLYLGIVLIFSSLASLLTILILMIYHKKGRPHQSSFIVTLARYASKLLCWKVPGLRTPVHDKNKVTQVKPIKNVRDDDSMETASVTSNDFAEEELPEKDGKLDMESIDSDDELDVTWEKVAILMDRFCFFAFAFTTVFMNGGFVLTLSTGGFGA